MHRWSHAAPRLLGRIRLALSRLAWAHVHETLIWAGKSKRARHTFNYDLLNGLGSPPSGVYPPSPSGRSSKATIQPRNL